MLPCPSLSPRRLDGSPRGPGPARFPRRRDPARAGGNCFGLADAGCREGHAVRRRSQPGAICRHGLVPGSRARNGNVHAGRERRLPRSALRREQPVRTRFRNHPSIAVWCARNEGFPPPEIDAALRKVLGELEPAALSTELDVRARRPLRRALRVTPPAGLLRFQRAVQDRDRQRLDPDARIDFRRGGR